MARTRLVGFQRLFAKGIGIGGQDEVATNEAVVRQRDANRAVRAAEVREIEVRIRQVERRLRALAPLLKDPNKQLDAEPAPAPALPGTPGR
jgi:hypothetical protein